MADYAKLKSMLIKRGETDIFALADAFELVRNDKDYAGNMRIREIALKRIVSTGDAKAESVYRKTLLFAAPRDFDSYLQYMEFERPFDKQFYVPRRRQLKLVVNALQELADGGLELLAVSLPPGVGKTTLALFFITWLAGRNPEKPILIGSHNKDFLAGTYGECLRLMDPQGEYLWKDVFPKLRIIQTNAKSLMIDIGEDQKKAKRFMTLEYTSIGSGNAGKVRAENLLYCDDLVDGIETALSKNALDKLWGTYTTDLRQRKIGNCRELHISTRWSLHDVIGRLEDRYDGNGKSRFIVIPALDENDKSNFNYPIEAGFSTAFYHEQREIMDDASWRALYMNQPIERYGQLYSEDELRRYFELPDNVPDAIFAVCDTKDRGTDYCVLPIVYQYGQDYYVEAVVCENYRPDIVEARLVAELVKHKVQMCQFESNAAGGKIAEKVQVEAKVRGGIVKCTTKWTSQNKETKIIVNAPWVIEHCLFKDSSVIKSDKEYRTFMNFLCSYTMAGKNKHDDVPDAMAQLALFCQNMAGNAIKVFNSPF